MRRHRSVPFGGAPPLRRGHESKRKRRKANNSSVVLFWIKILLLLLALFWLYETVQNLVLPYVSRESTSRTYYTYGTSRLFQRRAPSLLLNKNFCKYEGNCLEGKTCVYSSHSPLGGVCEDYMEDLDKGNTAWLHDCEASCQHDVVLDERFYFKFRPIFGATYMALPSAGRPDSCVVTFERQRNYTNDFSVEKWRSSLKHVLVRLDPFVNNKNMWSALCYSPCTTDVECLPSGYNTQDHVPPPFICKQGACQRSRRDWSTNSSSTNSDLVIVSGADSRYFAGLQNLAASVRYWAPNNYMVVYNLGMTKEQLQIVQGWSNLRALEWKAGIPDVYPPHVHVGKKYAWKSVIINETLHKYHKIFWADAGSTFVGPMDPIEEIIERTGSFLVWGQDEDMTPRAFEATFVYLNKTKADYKNWPHYGGGTQGHLFPSRQTESIVKPNAACALIKDCIDPPGANLGNHRYDQTVLSILAHSPRTKAWHHTEYLAATRAQLNHNLSLPSDKMIWSARQQCSYYKTLEENRRKGVH